jgi:hypothetical protein
MSQSPLLIFGKMSELRRLLRYEIPGLAIIIHVVLVSFIFLSFDECLELIKYLGKSAAAIALLSLFIGWLAIQVFEDRCQPHRKTRGFKRIKGKFKPIDDECCFAIIDYILKDDMYVNYPGLADTLRGYWDQYYARSIIGAGVPIVCFLTFIIFAGVELANFLRCDIAIHFSPPNISYILLHYSILKTSVLQIVLRCAYTVVLILYNKKLWDMLWKKSDRIFKEVEFQEYLFISNNDYKLSRVKYNSYIKDYLNQR